MDYVRYIQITISKYDTKPFKLHSFPYIIYQFSGLRPGVPDEGDSSDFEVKVGNASV